MKHMTRSRLRLRCAGNRLGAIQTEIKAFLHSPMRVTEIDVWTMLVRGNIVVACRRCCELDLIDFSYAGDRDEPLHVHVERDNNLARFWLDPVRLQTSGGFSRIEISRIQKLVEDNIEMLVRSWNEFFNR